MTLFHTFEELFCHLHLNNALTFPSQGQLVTKIKVILKFDVNTEVSFLTDVTLFDGRYMDMNS